MVAELLTRPATRLTSTGRVGLKLAPVKLGRRKLARTHVDGDGACTICDHPFGTVRHACLGA